MSLDMEPTVKKKAEPVAKEQKKRGGARPGAGRSNVLGETVRRDLRVSPEIQTEAIRVGRGSFSEGMRMMCEEYIRLRTRDTAVEPPPPDVPVLIFLPKANRWVVVTAEQQDGSTVFREASAPKQTHTADAWRPLPEAP